MCLCVFFPFILDIKFVGRAAAGVTQEEGHTGFFTPFLSAVRALIFLARRIQPSLGFPGCALLALLRPVPPTLALSSQRSQSVPRPVVLHVQSRTSLVPLSGPVIFPVLGRWAQTNQYCNLIPGSPLWVFALVTRPLLSCGRWFLTHWRCPQSALGRWCLRLLRPIGAQTQASCRVAVLRPKPYSSSQIPSDL